MIGSVITHDDLSAVLARIEEAFGRSGGDINREEFERSAEGQGSGLRSRNACGRGARS